MHVLQGVQKLAEEETTALFSEAAISSDQLAEVK
jgi:hypothetical protein